MMTRANLLGLLALFIATTVSPRAQGMKGGIPLTADAGVGLIGQAETLGEGGYLRVALNGVGDTRLGLAARLGTGSGGSRAFECEEGLCSNTTGRVTFASLEADYALVAREGPGPGALAVSLGGGPIVAHYDLRRSVLAGGQFVERGGGHDGSAFGALATAAATYEFGLLGVRSRLRASYSVAAGLDTFREVSVSYGIEL